MKMDDQFAAIAERATGKPEPQCGVWQPIETAPKDGTWIVVLRDGEPVAVFYRHTMRSGGWGPFVWVPANDGDPIAERVPTHWTPLPAMPARA